MYSFNKSIFLSFLFLVLLSAECLHSAPFQFNVEKLLNVKKLSDSVLLVRMGEEYPDQIAAINSEKGIVLIDSGISPTLSALYRKVIKKEFGRDDYIFVINTHHHFDHTNGNQVFSEALIVAHDNCPRQLKEFSKKIPEFINSRSERYQRRWNIAQSLDTDSRIFKRLRDLVFMSDYMCQDLKNNFKLTLPDLTFSDSLTLNLDDLTLKLQHFSGGFHTNNDIIAILPEEGIVFTGDLFFDSNVRSVVKSDHPLDLWIDLLEKVLSAVPELKYIVTIHQGVLTPGSLVAVKETFEEMKREQVELENGSQLLENLLIDLKVKNPIADFRTLVESQSDGYYFWEADLISIGESLLDKSNTKETVKLFKLVTEMFPESVSALYNLSDSYFASGDTLKAIECLERSLELDPVSSYAVDRIYQLKNWNKTPPPF
jgi:glyoxylase-like metal-dependent hydrolase (beta-lactamase superfamily II)